MNEFSDEVNSSTCFRCELGSTGTVQTAPKNEIHATFVADVKKAIGVEKSNQLFLAVQNYKKSDNYDNLVATVVSLLTEREEDFSLLHSKFFY